jgi:GDP-L-fucose synthase
MPPALSNRKPIHIRMSMTNNYFPYKRVTVTGGAGFLGRQVVQRLKAFSDVEVCAPRSREYDLIQMPDVMRLLDDAQPELVIHLAATVGGIGANQKSPGSFFYQNLMMGAQLMEQARVHGVQKFVALGTVCSYPKFTPVPFREENLWNGYPEETNAAYGIAKKAMLVQAQSYRQQYGFNAIHLLPANLYGPWDNFDLETSHVVPALIRKCVAARRQNLSQIEAWGSGEVSREFLYVEDCAEAILLAARDYNEGEAVNIGSGREVLIRELAEMIATLAGFKGEIKWQTGKPDGQPRRQLDVTRAYEKFGFRAQTTLEEGLRRTIDWYESSNPED